MLCIFLCIYPMRLKGSRATLASCRLQARHVLHDLVLPAGDSALTWQEEQLPSQEDLEMGLQQHGSAYSGHSSAHEQGL